MQPELKRIIFFEFNIIWKNINDPEKEDVRMRLLGRKEFISKKYELNWKKNLNLSSLVDKD